MRHLARRSSRAVHPMLLACGVALLAACGERGGSGAARGDTTQVARGGAGKTVAVVLPTRSTDFWRRFEEGLKEAAERGDYALRVEVAELDTARERGAVDRIIRDGADALVVAPLDGAAAASEVGRAAEAGLPVFTAGLEVPGAPVISHVAMDDVAGGEIAAAYIATFLRGRGEVGIVGLPGTPAGDAREAGFRRALSSQQGMKVLASAGGGGTREAARIATDSMLKANPQIDAIFVTSEAQTLGVLDATRERWQELVIVGYGLNAEARDAIVRESPLKAVVLEAPRELGMRALQVAAEHLSNEGVPPRLAVGVKLVTAGNVADSGK